MPTTNSDEPVSEREARLRVDARKLAEARALLADIDGRVFGGLRSHSENAHAGVISRIVAGLFSHG